MLEQNYDHEWQYAADVIGCATLLAARRKCEVDLKIIFSKDVIDQDRVAESITMQSHVEVMLEMFPEEVVEEATNVVDFILKRWQES